MDRATSQRLSCIGGQLGVVAVVLLHTSVAAQGLPHSGAVSQRPEASEAQPSDTRGPAEPVIAVEAPEVPEVPEVQGGSAPPAELQARYQALAADAVGEYRAGHWAEARALFLAAHRLWPSARTFRTLGMTAFELRDYPSALRELTAALSEPERPLSPSLREEVAALIERTRVFVGTFRLAITPADAALRIDGEPARLEASPDGGTLVRLSVGRHEVLVRAAGYIDSRRILMVQGREDRALTVALTPVSPVPLAQAPPRPSQAAEHASNDGQRAASGSPEAEALRTARPERMPAAPATDTPGGRLWTWVALGGAAALGLASGALWLAGDAELSNLAETCQQRPANSPCAPGDLPATGSLERLDRAHQITLGLSVVAVATAGVLYFLEAPRPAVGLALAGNGARLSLRW